MTSTASPTVRQLGVAVRTLLVLTALLGLAYPLLMTGLAQVLFPHQADGSLIRSGDEVVGSEIIGQSFEGHPQYFQSRPSAAGDGYDPTSSSASNLGAENPVLIEQVLQRRAAAAELDGVPEDRVAPDALLASGSGLDPDISVEYARQQVRRVAARRGLDPAQVEDLVEQHTDGRNLGFLGEPHVNVLMLNLALDGLSAAPEAQTRSSEAAAPREERR